MKRIISLFLCLILFVSLFSCESVSEIGKDDNSKTESSFSIVSEDDDLALNQSSDGSHSASEEVSNEAFDNEGEVSDENSEVSNDEDEISDENSEGEDSNDESDEPENENSGKDNENNEPETSKPEDENGEEDDEPEACKHKNTKIINKKDSTTTSEGYTGDKVCADCGTILQKGETTEKLKESVKYVTYTNAYGDKITVPDNVDVFQHTLAQANKTAVSENPDVEAEILRLTNIERVNAGLQPLKNETGAYYFAKLRAEECHEIFSHTRPNGQGFHTVFCDEKVFYVYAGENLAKCTNYPYEEYASVCVEGWMNSEGHRANILNPKFTSVAIATVVVGNTQCSVQLFFGKP
jgi:uncharacterized protein YkwD